MALIFERIHTDGIAELSYLVGDDSKGVAAVFDPRPDVDCYLQLAREKKVSITHIFETHIHVDFVSGARELCARLKSAKIYLSHEGGARYGFDHEGVTDGDVFELGSALITARHTPGHSPEHMAYLLSEKEHPDAPWGVLTGDSLFVNSAGRSDLLGSSQAKELAEKLFHTLNDFYLKLNDGVIIYPTHGQGSPCGEDIGDRLSSTIGYERRFNAFLQFNNATSFTEHTLTDAAPIPTYYPLMETLNTKGPMVLGNLPPVPGLPPKFFQEAIEGNDNVLIDTRMMLGFGGGHIKGALSIGGLPVLSIWAGWLLDPDQPILLVLDSDDMLETIVRYFVRTGYTKFAGYLVGGMTAWNNAGLPLESVGQTTVHEIKNEGQELQVLDVRAPSEWKEGHIPNARHIFLGELREQLGTLDKAKPTAVYCDSGYRASIATSILQQHGFGGVCNIPGSWQAWENAGYPVEKEIEKEKK
ncbi:MAG: MBL fold metallo-hydrolase [Desulfomicrobium sp.]|nr:MBL fold metallo-hydrolase [Pseudomonadota bacterium]MBV1713229.1 MBL fold metallo-hydrolase [Desulfomicrobium sp.]MBU4571333.1 MBL fold metallo-hydrolase [Pseudomonadota bacterium]MBU4595595.1 MBL fold metallo-hydrolase [Pseudomonadota bacterium]MBV1720037.1 MBL fold metallo-hydrolase [Desulfomicrobium sp.]